MKNIFKCAMIVIGTLIGAGFASGKEIASFFNVFLDEGLYGLLISCAIFGIIIYCVMNLINKYELSKYEELVNGNKFVLFIMKAFTFVCFCIMISAIGSYGEQQYSISFWYGASFAGIICFILFLFKFSGLEKLNNFLVPFILVGIFILGIANYDVNSVELEVGNFHKSIFMNNWFISALLYAGYNSILLIPILAELNIYKLKKRDVFLLSCFSTLLLSIAGVLIYFAISLFYPDILSIELPTLFLAEVCGKAIKYFYSIVILFAIFTTAFSCGYSFLRMSKGKNYFRNTCLICVLGVILSRIGFSDMINFFFPIFGYLGILQVLIIVLSKRKVNK